MRRQTQKRIDTDDRNILINIFIPMPLTLPPGYQSTLTQDATQDAIPFVKDTFQQKLAEALNLRRATAPLFVLAGKGLNDNLSGAEQPVSFPIKAMEGQVAEVVHSLAKWKRLKLGQYKIPAGCGIYTDMNAIRAEEDLDNIHSLYVDQWDWERTITAEDRNLDFLKMIVRKIFSAMKELETEVFKHYPDLPPLLPEEITFIQSEELLQKYPNLPPERREFEVAKEHKAVFIIGIGGELSNGTLHDGRAPDYDDWSTLTENGYKGLNGDLIVWNPILESNLELSSMGIRVDKSALLQQLTIRGCEYRKGLDFHRALLDEKLPLSIGGGIGQSRLCMFVLRKAHVGEVQASIWSEEMIDRCAEHGITLM
jgi:aspartate--ammonia ligase